MDPHTLAEPSIDIPSLQDIMNDPSHHNHPVAQNEIANKTDTYKIAALMLQLYHAETTSAARPPIDNLPGWNQ